MENTLSNKRLAVAAALMALLGLVGPLAPDPSAFAGPDHVTIQNGSQGVFQGGSQEACTVPEILGAQEKDAYMNWRTWTPVESSVGPIDRSAQPWGQPNTLCMDIGGNWC
jgi:hypothetical protein